MACNLCGATTKELLYERNDYRVWRCRSCALTYVDPLPSIVELKELYADAISTRGEKYHYRLSHGKLRYAEQANDRDKLNLVRRYQKNGSLLDVGCARGFFLHQAKEFYEVHGAEYSAQAVVVARKLRLDVREGEIFDIGGTYNIITLWDVLEHVRNPSAVVEDARRKLKKRGYLFLSTGDIGALLPKLSGKYWHLMTPPWHLYYFSKKTIRRLLESHGFRVVEMKHGGRSTELRWLLFKLGDITGSPIFARLHELAKDRRLAKLRLRINTLDILTVVAQRR